MSTQQPLDFGQVSRDVGAYLLENKMTPVSIYPLLDCALLKTTMGGHYVFTAEWFEDATLSPIELSKDEWTAVKKRGSYHV